MWWNATAPMGIQWILFYLAMGYYAVVAIRWIYETYIKPPPYEREEYWEQYWKEKDAQDS
jgi:hypothetical protein